MKKKYLPIQIWPVLLFWLSFVCFVYALIFFLLEKNQNLTLEKLFLLLSHIQILWSVIQTFFI